MPKDLTVEKATDKDMFRFYGTRLLNPWSGLVAKVGDRIVGFGGVYLNNDYEYVGFMDLRRASRIGLAYRYVKRFISEIQDNGCRELIVSCDTKFDKAEVFLERLGFEKTERKHDGLAVWRIRPTPVDKEVQT